MASIEKRTSCDGTESYRVKVRLKGARVESATFARKTDAKRWAAKLENDLREGRYFKTAEAKRHTLAEAIERYIEKVLPDKRGSAPTQKAQLLQWKTRLGHLPLADVTAAVVAAERDALLAENLGTEGKPRRRAPATVVRYLAVLSHLFTVAMKDWGWVEDNPLRKIRKPKEPRGRTRVLSDEARKALLEACHLSKASYLYPLVVLALSTGMRRGEMLSLTRRQVDLEKGRIVLTRTKNGEQRVVPLGGLALELLKPLVQACADDDALVFPGAKPATPVHIESAWHKALERAGIEDFRFHDLRHCAASYLLEAGATEVQLAEILGHKSLQMVKRYAHLREPESARIIGAMNKRIFGGDGRESRP
jgi:integrase